MKIPTTKAEFEAALERSRLYTHILLAHPLGAREAVLQELHAAGFTPGQAPQAPELTVGVLREILGELPDETPVLLCTGWEGDEHIPAGGWTLTDGGLLLTP